jgi:DNA-binding GntR family transcriptional regulator
MSFHIAICHAARNEVLRNAVQLLRNLMRQWIYYKLLIPDVAPTVLKRHTAIYRAISRRKPSSARTEMRHHLEETMRLVTQVVEQRELQATGRSGQRAVTPRARPSSPQPLRESSPPDRGKRSLETGTS